jgi:hypothetical protein
LFEKIHIKNFWPKKVEKKNVFPVVFSHRFCLSRFWPFLCMRSPKTPQKYFLKSDLKI